jgi:hypothetical protein
MMSKNGLDVPEQIVWIDWYTSYLQKYLGRSESKNTRSVFHKSKTFTFCGQHIMVTLYV